MAKRTGGWLSWLTPARSVGDDFTSSTGALPDGDEVSSSDRDDDSTGVLSDDGEASRDGTASPAEVAGDALLTPTFRQTFIAPGAGKAVPVEESAEPAPTTVDEAFHVKQDDADVAASSAPAQEPALATDDAPLARELSDLTRRRHALEGTSVSLSGGTRIITVSNQKGGVGKTTSTVNLAAALAKVGARVVVIDLDPQGNASTALGIPHHDEIASVYDVLIDEAPLADVLQASPESPDLLCAPSTIHLAGAEIELVAQTAREHRLSTAISTYLGDSPQHVDFVLIDCPPSLGLLTINAFAAAHEVLIPIQCEYYALEGLSQLTQSISLIQQHLNPRLHLSSILLTMYDGRTRLAQEVAAEVRTHFPHLVLDTVIPRSVRVSEAPSFGQTVVAYDGASAGAVAYREAAIELVRRGDEATPTTHDKENP